MIHKIVFLLLLLFPSISLGLEKADRVVVVKSKSRMLLYSHGEVIKSYHVAFGANPKGHKRPGMCWITKSATAPFTGRKETVLATALRGHHQNHQNDFMSF